MDIDLRQHIFNNFKDNETNEIKEAIVSGIDSKEEVALPGLGVFFEILWNNSTDEEKELILNSIKKGL